MATMGQTTRLVHKYITERLRRQEIVEGTANGLRYRLTDLADHVPAASSSVRRKHVERWMERPDLSPGSLQLRLSAARGFCQWCVLNGKMKTDPTLGLKAPRSPQRKPRNLHADESPQLVVSVPDLRARVIVLLMLQECLRCAEVAGMQLGDIDFTRREVDIRGKGGRGGVTRTVPLSDETIVAIDAYLNEFPAAAGPLLRSYLHPACGIGRKYISGLVSQWMYDAGIKKAPRDGKSGHALRHTGATDMINNGADIYRVQVVLGHSSSATTGVYIRGATPDIRAAMAGRSYTTPVDPRLIHPAA